MMQDQCVDGLEPIEKRYKQDYSDHEREIFFKQYLWMTSEMWRDLCGLVLAKDFYRIPAVEDFRTIQLANPDRFRRSEKVNEKCGACKGTGVRRFLQRCRERKHIAPAARCDCRNGNKWSRFPSLKEAEALPGFVRLLGCHESDFGAVAAADLAMDDGTETEEMPEIGAGDVTPF